MIKYYTVFLFAIFFNLTAKAQEIKNFTRQGQQITKFDDLGRAVDAHDGEIAYFKGTYYLYGTSYDCGFEWNNKTAPFCGFKSYSSKDMINWKDEGYLFDATNVLWQSRCDGKTYGCFRPHVVYNKKNKNYVLWINVYDNVSGYRVFTSRTPIGPFTEVKEPTLIVNGDMPAGGLNNGDHDLFIDDDGICYLAFTDWRTKGTIVIEQLTDDFLSGTGKYVKSITPGSTEAPALFKRKGIYYVTYSDPNCGYCPGTGTSYRTASSPLGPWSEGKQISTNSCGGQPSFVSTMKINSQTIYLYGSDLWNNAAKNEALANFYWAPLTFAEDGSINPMECLNSFTLSKSNKMSSNATTTGTSLGSSNKISLEGNDFKATCDIGGNLQRSQSFRATSSGVLKTFGITTLKSGYPSRDLSLEFYESEGGKIKNHPLANISISRDSIGWSAKNLTVHPNINLAGDKEYTVIIKSDTNQGCYGFAFNDSDSNAGGAAAISNDKGKSFVPEKNRKLKFNFLIE